MLVFVKRYIAVIFLLLAVYGCTEKRSSDAEETYKLWSFMPPPKQVKPMQGQYWQSAGLTREYIAYLQFEATPEWSTKYIEQNKLVLTNRSAAAKIKGPDWFSPTARYLYYTHPNDATSQYWFNTRTNVWLIFEEQL